MKIYFFILLPFLFLSCNNAQQQKEPDAIKAPNEIKTKPDFDVALKFINDYVGFCQRNPREMPDSLWISNNPLLTGNFKKRYSVMIDSAYKADAESGLGSDPVFDAQDFDDKGFSILKTDAASGYVTVRGKKWKELNIVLKVAQENSQWRVDGSGIINIPRKERAKR